MKINLPFSDKSRCVDDAFYENKKAADAAMESLQLNGVKFIRELRDELTFPVKVTGLDKPPKSV